MGFAAWLLGALALTLVTEVPVAFALGLRRRPQILAVIYVNLLTNPTLNLIAAAVWSGLPSALLPTLLSLEAGVVVAEWRLLSWAIGGSSGRLLLVAAVMNAASAAVGLFVWPL